MKVTKHDVEHVANLARLRFSDDEVPVFAEQLTGILDFFEKLQLVDTAGITPSTHAVNLTNALRNDEPKDCLPVDASLKNAPEAVQSYFKVPKIIETE